MVDLCNTLFKKEWGSTPILRKRINDHVQGDLSINAFYLKAHTLCWEIIELDPKAKFDEDRMRRIIVNGLNSKYDLYTTTIQRWF